MSVRLSHDGLFIPGTRTSNDDGSFHIQIYAFVYVAMRQKLIIANYKVERSFSICKPVKFENFDAN